MQIIQREGYNPGVITVSGIQTIGKAALHACRTHPSGNVIGRTSHGDFLRLGEDAVIFLSNETFRGPLSLNFQQVPGVCEGLQNGDAILTRQDGIYFPDYDWLLTFPGSGGWTAALPANRPILAGGVLSRLKSVATALLEQKSPSLISENLYGWLEISQPEPLLSGVALSLDRFHKAVESSRDEDILDYLEPIIGRGDGLTPSGDDCILGILLTYGRWADPFFQTIDLNRIIPRLFESIRTKTTLLSSSLIRSAWEGQADERLVLALDGIVTGDIEVKQIAEWLASWGNHSGSDALTGMALLLSLISK